MSTTFDFELSNASYLSPENSPSASFDDFMDCTTLVTSDSSGLDSSFDFSHFDSAISKPTFDAFEQLPPSPISSVDGKAETIVPSMLSRSTTSMEVIVPVVIKKEEPAEKKKAPPKKRKSWGQVLPKPTTNLPPRKRAKTEAEKEQRRIERVYRNRDAAQKSRERKRKEYEYLEEQNKLLKATVANYHQALQKVANEQERYHQEVAMCLQKKVNTEVLHSKIMALPIVSIPEEPVFASFDEQNPLSPEDMMDGLDTPAATPAPENCQDTDMASHESSEVIDSMQHPAAMLTFTDPQRQSMTPPSSSSKRPTLCNYRQPTPPPENENQIFLQNPFTRRLRSNSSGQSVSVPVA